MNWLSGYTIKSQEEIDLNNEAVIWASSKGHIKLLNYLLNDLNADPSCKRNESMAEAISNGHLEIVNRLLIDPRVSINGNFIRDACARDHIDIVNRLLKDSRVDPSCLNNWCIRHTVDNNKYEITYILLKDSRVDPSVDNNWCLRHACRNGNIDIINLLLIDSRVVPDNELLIKASEKGDNIITVERLLEDPRVILTLEIVKKVIANRRPKIIDRLIKDPFMIPFYDEIIDWATSEDLYNMKKYYNERLEYEKQVIKIINKLNIPTDTAYLILMLLKKWSLPNNKILKILNGYKKPIKPIFLIISQNFISCLNKILKKHIKNNYE